jgi:hypothetical protein
VTDHSKQAELEARIAENERRITEVKADASRRDRLKPIWMLRAVADQVARNPDGVNWSECITQLEAALVAARGEADSSGEVKSA